MAAVYADLHRGFGISSDQAAAAYATILAEHTADAFVSGRDSQSYRTERFSALLAALGVPHQAHLPTMLWLYETTLTRELRLLDGVPDVLTDLRQQGFQLAIITDGPDDAQLRTIRHLGLEPLIDRIYTSNVEGLAKRGGLFARVLERLGIEPGELLHVGDSLENDIRAAAALGISTAWLRGDDAAAAGPCPATITIRHLRDLMPSIRSIQRRE